MVFPMNHRTNLQGMDILVLSPTPTYPLDQGNRKRVYSVCRQFQERGARIHFLHYPLEWVAGIPGESLRQMSQQWDSFYQVPPTRPLHAEAEGEDHRIDEWWDYGIGDYLRWLFSHRYFDAFVVNYPYLSKAFEYAPSHVYRILDTHDRFTGRRQLLEAQGIGREYFHTTQDQEAIALQRSDLIWAIKEQEEDFFRQISPTPVCTLHHIEPQNPIGRVLTPEDEDYLVLGNIGVRNSINVQNAKAFIHNVLPKFRKYLAPIKIKFAGGMCTDLQEFAGRGGIELMGWVESVESFYAAIDAIVVPMTFSTGLKIKAVEALTTGLPIVAHKHAMEGIPINHSFQACQSLDEIAEACLELAYDRSLLKDLAGATKTSYRQMHDRVERSTLWTIGKMLKGRSLIAIVLNEQFFEENSPAREHAIQTIYYLKHLGDLVYYVDAPLTKKRAAAFKYHNIIGKIVLSPEAAKASGLEDSREAEALLGVACAVSSLEEFCTPRQILCLWLLDVPTQLQSGIASALRSIPVYVRTDVLRSHCQEKGDIQILLSLLKEFRNLTLVSCSLSALSGEGDLLPHARTAVVPYWRQLPDRFGGSWQSAAPPFILAHRSTMVFAYAVWKVCTRLFPAELYPAVFMAGGDAVEILPGETWQGDSQWVAAMADEGELLDRLGDRRPQFVLDLSGNCPQFAIACETFKRAGVPMIIPNCEGSSWLAAMQKNSVFRPVSVFDLISLLGRLVMDESYLAELEEEMRNRSASEYANDAGWSRIWRELTQHKQMSSLVAEFNLAA